MRPLPASMNWDIPRTKAIALDCNLMLTGPAEFDATNSYNVPAWISADLGLGYSFPKEAVHDQSASRKRVQCLILGFRVFRRTRSFWSPRVVTVLISKSF